MAQVAMAVISAVGLAGLLLAAWLFARSLLPGSTPLVARFALSEDAMAEQRPGAQRYLWWLTLLWALFLFACVGATAARLAPGDLVPPHAALAAMLGGALLFVGERWLRAAVFGAETVGAASTQWRNAASILRTEAADLFQRHRADAVPLFRLDDDERPLIVWRDACCSVGALRGAARSLADELPTGQRVLIVCDDRAAFLWAVLACWLARRTVVLPPADLGLMLTAADKSHFDCVLTDRAGFVAGRGPIRRIHPHAIHAVRSKPAGRSAGDTLPASHLAAIFFTSGSTGAPVAQAKTWRQLVEGAGAMRDLLRIGGTDPLLGGTVVHSHMFGFEMLVMQALQGSASVYSNRIVYPSDLAAFASIGDREKWLVTTPYHLGVFASAGQWAPGLRRIVSATMPLELDLAVEVEEASGAEVHEIYGSTEAGCIATRRTRRGQGWQLAVDLRLSVEHGVARLHARRVGGTLTLSDRIELQATGFRLLGRDSDLVKVAGKRASLQGLTQLLCGIEGVKDGCFVDGTRFGHKRLAAIVVAPGMSSKSVREALASMIDATFLPRPLLLVDELPRDANGKLRLDRLLKTSPDAPERTDPAMADARLNDAA